MTWEHIPSDQTCRTVQTVLDNGWPGSPYSFLPCLICDNADAVLLVHRGETGVSLIN